MLDKTKPYTVLSFKDRARGEFLLQNGKYYRRDGVKVSDPCNAATLDDELSPDNGLSYNEVSFSDFAEIRGEIPEDRRKTDVTCKLCGKKIGSTIGFYSHMRANHPEDYKTLMEGKKHERAIKTKARS